MRAEFLPLVIGGFLPALLYGISALFSKCSSQAGIGVAPYVTAVGLAIVLSGLVMLGAGSDTQISMRSGIFALLGGVLWAAATGLVMVALHHYQVPLTKLVPLYNMNTLVAVLLALLFLGESKEVDVTRLVLGAVLVTIGGIFVSTS